MHLPMVVVMSMVVPLIMSMVVPLTMVMPVAVMVSVAVPILIASFCAPKVVFPVMVAVPVGPFAAVRHRSPVAVAAIEAAIHVPVEVIGPMEPRPRTDKQAAIKPLRAVVAEWSAVVGCVVVVAVGACRLATDIDAEADLSLCFLGSCCKADYGNHSQGK